MGLDQLSDAELEEQKQKAGELARALLRKEQPSNNDQTLPYGAKVHEKQKLDETLPVAPDLTRK